MVVLDTYNSLAGLAYTISAVWDGIGTTAQTVKATSAFHANLTTLRLSMMKFGLPNATLRFDCYDSAMNLVDWTATFNASTLSAVRFMNKTLTFINGYECALGEVMWVGCRCTASVLLNGLNYVMLETDVVLPNTVKSRISGAWNSLNGKLDFTLNGTEIILAALGGSCGNSVLLVSSIAQYRAWRNKRRRFVIADSKA